MNRQEIEHLVNHYQITIFRTPAGEKLQILANLDEARENIEAIRSAKPEIMDYLNAREAEHQEQIEKLREEARTPDPSMPVYLTVEYAPAWRITLQSAQYFSEADKQQFSPDYQDRMMRPVGDASISLEHLRWYDLFSVIGKEQCAGEFCGCSNQVYIITREQWDTLAALDAKKGAEKAENEKMQEIAALKAHIARAELQMRDGRLPDRQEARRKWTEYNNVMNEGGEGYVPHFYAQEEYDSLVSRLNDLEGK